MPTLTYEMVVGYSERSETIGAGLKRSIEYGRNAVLERMDISWLQCVMREREGHCENMQIPLAPNYECAAHHGDDPEPEPEMLSSLPSSVSSMQHDHRVVPQTTANLAEVGRIESRPTSASSLKMGMPKSGKAHVDTDISAMKGVHQGRSALPGIALESFADSVDIESTCCSTCCSRDTCFHETDWDSSFAWRFSRVWEDLPSPSPLMVSSCIESEPVILCCARQDRWCSLSVEQSSIVGNRFLAQGHALKLMHDYSDLFTMNVTNSVAGDPTQIFFRSADEGHYLLCLSNTLCVCDRAQPTMWQGMAGWEKMQLRPAVPGNHYCFHLYCPSGSGLASSASQLPICFNEETGCLTQAQPEPGCEPAVFALHTASSALLLQEIIVLTGQCNEAREQFKHYDKFLKLRKFACNGTPAEHAPELQRLSSMRNAAEEQLVFLEDNLAFVREQLDAKLQDAGAGAAHGLPPEACIPDSKDSLSCMSESSKSTVKSDSDVEISQKARLQKVLNLL